MDCSLRRYSWPLAGAAGVSRVQVRLVPKSALGILLGIASVAHLVDMLAAFLLPDLDKAIHPFASIVPAVAEIWMVLYLLAVGVRTVKVDTPTLAAAPPTAVGHLTGNHGQRAGRDGTGPGLRRVCSLHASVRSTLTLDPFADATRPSCLPG